MYHTKAKRQKGCCLIFLTLKKKYFVQKIKDFTELCLNIFLSQTAI